MACKLVRLSAVAAWLAVSHLAAQTGAPKLLPTEWTARKLRALQAGLHSEENLQARKADSQRRERDFAQLKATVTAFVIAQLEAAPELEWWQLREQLVRILGVRFESRSPDHFREAPYAFLISRSGKDAPTVWAVAYREYVHYGMCGERVVVESYVVEHGKARLAGCGGAEMKNYGLQATQLWNPSPHTASIAVHGILGWASWHVLPARAVLCAVGPEGVKAIWQLTAHGIHLVNIDGQSFAVAYHDESRHQRGLPSEAVDVYDSYDQAGPIRVVHQYKAFPQKTGAEQKR